MARIKRALMLTNDIRHSVRNAVPWSLSPDTRLPPEEKARLEAQLRQRFELWADTWVLSRLDEIDKALGYKPETYERKAD